MLSLHFLPVVNDSIHNQKEHEVLIYDFHKSMNFQNTCLVCGYACLWYIHSPVVDWIALSA